jgi:hypothetical protein
VRRDSNGHAWPASVSGTHTSTACRSARAAKRTSNASVRMGDKGTGLGLWNSRSLTRARNDASRLFSRATLPRLAGSRRSNPTLERTIGQRKQAGVRRGTQGHLGAERLPYARKHGLPHRLRRRRVVLGQVVVQQPHADRVPAVRQLGGPGGDALVRRRVHCEIGGGGNALSAHVARRSTAIFRRHAAAGIHS